MAIPFKLFVVVLFSALVIAACAPAASTPEARIGDFPEAAQAVLFEQIASEEMALVSAARAQTPRALRDTSELWCVIANITLGEDNAIRRPYIVFVTAANEWAVSTSETDEFFEAGCANYRDVE